MFGFGKKDETKAQIAPAQPAEPQPYSLEWFAKKAYDIGVWKYGYLHDKEPNATLGKKAIVAALWDEAVPGTGREEYLKWVVGWKAAYKRMSKEDGIKWNYRDTRWAMMLLRAEGKRISWERKL